MIDSQCKTKLHEKDTYQKQIKTTKLSAKLLMNNIQHHNNQPLSSFLLLIFIQINRMTRKESIPPLAGTSDGVPVRNCDKVSVTVGVKPSETMGVS